MRGYYVIIGILKNAFTFNGVGALLLSIFILIVRNKHVNIVSI